MRVSGFEPEINGSANRRLCPLDCTRKTGTRGEIRTLNILFLRQAPLPIWPRVHGSLPVPGLEPGTCRLENDCSNSFELHRQWKFRVRSF